ncbi:helix-turn-helix domain-containing protein [Anaerosalibacter bizertensis]|uniref:helix-turn-helix transcriptional regulator n=1 Tax=Anaerosalibacter bizertensis TaxID=932217 RepID=UPI001C0EA0E6|nr:helix-turn-helix domain-containing protein [Anaerosalibacter bizertensis]MBU5292788.1 helix-turn-helix domain-containing protein [Anaerosalibacter bizertensis]
MKNKMLIGYRKMYGITQKDLARLIKVSPTTYSYKENGKTYFNQEEMIVITNILKKYNPMITMDDIFFRNNVNLKLTK